VWTYLLNKHRGMVRRDREHEPELLAELALERQLKERKVRSMIDETSLRRTLIINDILLPEIPRMMMQIQSTTGQLVDDWIIPDGMLVRRTSHHVECPVSHTFRPSMYDRSARYKISAVLRV
jgi:hypothetical protein